MQDEAVTPVVGTVMILGITILGIGAIMLWGAPTLQAIQDRNAVVAMQGEFIEVRTGTLDLMIDKSSRVPEIVMQAGSLELQEGTRMLIASNQFETLGGAYAGCTFVIADWDDADGAIQIEDTGCTALDDRPGACPAAANRLCLEAARVTGSNEDDLAFTDPGGTYGYDLTGQDLTDGTYVFRLLDDGGEVAAQAWLLGTDRLQWSLATISGTYGVTLEGGAVFETNGIRTFIVKSPALQEDASGINDVFLRIPAYIADDYGGFSGSGTPSVFIGQVGNNHARIQSDATDSIRYAFAGDLAESWCRSLLARNTGLDASSYSEPTTDACSDDVAVVAYAQDDASSFPFELSHARITTRIQL